MATDPTPDAGGKSGQAQQAAANDAAFAASASSVRVLRLNLGAERVPRKNSRGKGDELWIGTGYAETGEPDLPIYVRLGPGQPLAAELVCAVLGRAAGLPIPEPFVVAVERKDLPRSRFTRAGATTYAFGCRALDGKDFAQLYNVDGAGALDMLMGWRYFVATAAFDEWLANVDRNLGNIVYAAQNLWLIDHADALGGSSSRLFALADLIETSFTNKLADHFMSAMDHGLRHAQLQQAKDWLGDAARLDLPSAVAMAGLDNWHDPAKRVALLDFVRQRLLNTHRLLCNRLGHPQLSLALSPEASQLAGSQAGVPSSTSRPD